MISEKVKKFIVGAFMVLAVLLVFNIVAKIGRLQSDQQLIVLALEEHQKLHVQQAAYIKQLEADIAEAFKYVRNEYSTGLKR